MRIAQGIAHLTVQESTLGTGTQGVLDTSSPSHTGMTATKRSTNRGALGRGNHEETSEKSEDIEESGTRRRTTNDEGKLPVTTATDNGLLGEK